MKPLSPVSLMRKGQGGFTLLEILVAVTILAVTFSALSRVYGGALRNMENGERRARAALLAESKMDGLLNTEPLQPFTDNGKFLDNPGYSYRSEVAPYEKPIGRSDRPVMQDATERLATYSVSVEVSWKDEGRDKKLDLHTLKTVVEESK